MNKIKSFNRRTFLRGVGGTFLSLPWLELTAENSKTKKFKKPNLRFMAFYSPNGFTKKAFFPNEGDTDYLAMPTLQPLKKLKRKLL